MPNFDPDLIQFETMKP